MRTGRWFASTAIALLCAGCSAGSASPPNAQVHLVAEPFSATFDTPVHITVNGLPSGGLVTLRAQTDDSEDRRWESAAQFRASAAGTLNLATAVPVSGSYRVADAAGLLWSLHPAFTTDPATQFYMNGTGFVVQLQVVSGGRVQAVTTLVRRGLPAISQSVQTVARTGLAGTLFTPASVRPGAPVVVVIGGSEGGNSPSAFINAASSGTGAAWTLHRRPLPTLSEIPAGNLRVPLLLGDGGEDQVWGSAPSATVIVQELRDSGDRAPYTNLYYPGAGHGFFGVPPGIPYSDYGSTGGLLGGSEQANALAAEQFWTTMIRFIHRVWIGPPGRALLDRYTEWAASVDRFSPVLVETDFEVNVLDPVRPEAGLVTAAGDTVRYAGRIDLMAVDAHDEYWIVRHRVVDAGWTPTEQLVRPGRLTACTVPSSVRPAPRGAAG